MLERKPIFPNVIEMNHQAGHVIGCNVYLIYDADEWILIDIGYEDTVNDGDILRIGSLDLEVWSTPGHTAGQLAFRLSGLLFSGDTIYRDGCVGAIDAHHGSDIPAFIRSLDRIRQSDVEWLLPGHGPYFRKDNGLLDKAITRLEGYQHMADFGTCASDWPLMDEWERELADGIRPS